MDNIGDKQARELPYENVDASIQNIYRQSVTRGIMTPRRNPVVLLLYAFLALSAVSWGQDSRSFDTDVLRELRAIHDLLERSTTLTARTQLLIWKVQAADQRIAKLTEKMAKAEHELKEADVRREHALNLAKRSEVERNQPDTPNLRRDLLQTHIEDYKRRAEKELEKQTQAQMAKMQFEADLDIERARQLESMTQLDEIGRLLAEMANKESR